MRFKKGDRLSKAESPTIHCATIDGVFGNPWDDELHYSIQFPWLSFSIGYAPAQIDDKYVLTETQPKKRDE
jgi:hypothetical protein